MFARDAVSGYRSALPAHVRRDSGAATVPWLYPEHMILAWLFARFVCCLGWHRYHRRASWCPYWRDRRGYW
jgi:hypothetical protein